MHLKTRCHINKIKPSVHIPSKGLSNHNDIIYIYLFTRIYTVMTKTQEDTASVAQYTCGLFIKVKTLNIVSLVKVNSIQCFELGHYIYKAECSGILDKN